MGIAMITAPPAPAGQSAGFSQARNLITNGGFIVTRDHKILNQLNPQRLFIPASTWKIATASMALHMLGENFRFQTFFYQDNRGRLFIQGKGDPFLTSEEISRLIPNLKKYLKMPVSAITIDDNNFQLNSRTDGSSLTANPYDADLSALAVNFNTVNLQISPKGITSAEAQTPTLPIMTELAKGLKPGRQRISLHNIKDTTNYAGQLFAALGLNKDSESMPIKRGKTPKTLKAIYIHHNSKNLSDLIKSLLLYSNNFIANQIFLTCGANQFGWPATWDKARNAMDIFLRETVGLPGNSYKIMEGSGLSRQNMITPEAMLKLLYYFKPHADLLPIHHQQRMKSGTLTGVYAYAGYLSKSNSAEPFIMILNQPNNIREKIMGFLISGWSAQTSKIPPPTNPHKRALDLKR